MQAAKKKRRWQHVSGPSAALVDTLIDHDWQMSNKAGNMWDTRGNEWELLAERPEALEAALREDLLHSCWRTAGEQRNGKGLHVPPTLAPVRKARAAFQAQGRHKEATYVEKVASAAVYLAARRAEVWPQLDLDSGCPWCGQEQTEEHAYWTCPRLPQHEAPEVAGGGGEQLPAHHATDLAYN